MNVREKVSLALLCLAAFAAVAQAEPKSCGTAPVPGSESQLAFVKCSAANRDWNVAEEQIRSYRSHHPDSLDGALIEADVLTTTHRFEDAMQVLDPMLRLHPRSIPVLSLDAEIWERLGDADEAERLLKKATEYAPADPEVWKRLGDLYLAKRPRDAVPCFQRAIQLIPGDAVALAGLASAFHGVERVPEARKTFAQAIALNRKLASPSAIPDYLYARFLADEEDFKQSVVEYNRALKEDPDFLDAYFGRAGALVELHDWAAAVPDLERALLEPKHELPALALMVRVFRELGQTEKAKDCSQRLARASNERDRQRVAGNEIAGQMQTASGFMQESKFEEAAQAYQRLVDGHPEATHAWLQLGRCYAELGRLGDAETAFRKVISLDGASAVAHVLLGRVLLQEKETSPARSEFLAAQRLDPLNLDAGLGLAATDIMENQYRDAVRTLRETRRVSANDGDVSLMLAEALFKDGRREEAQHEVKQLLKSEPNNPAAQRMLDVMTGRSPGSP